MSGEPVLKQRKKRKDIGVVRTEIGVASKIDGVQNREYYRLWRLANRERVNAQNKEWRQKNKHRPRQNPMVYHKMVISFLRAKDNDRCWICGEHVAEGTASIDHEIMVQWGGSDEHDNLRLAHLLCNMRRPRRNPEA